MGNEKLVQKEDDILIVNRGEGIKYFDNLFQKCNSVAEVELLEDKLIEFIRISAINRTGKIMREGD